MNISKSDWEKLTPDQFEELCTKLLELLKFENVHHLGGPGDRGRDVVCEKTIESGPGITERFSYVIQCKHYPKSINKANLLDDLAAATEHKCDIWWLMTTAKLTPNLADWLNDASKSDKYPFKIDYVDRDKLEQMLSRFLKLIKQYFPDKVSATELAQEDAMERMEAGYYEEASHMLQEKDDGSHPQFSYLLACCFSVIAEHTAKQSEAISRAYEYLSEASKRGYVEYLQNSRRWPRSRCLHGIHQDIELQFIKKHDTERFNSIFPEPFKVEPKGRDDVHKKHGGCFPPDTLIKLSDGRVMPIAQAQQGEEVVSLISYSNISYSRIEKVPKAMVYHIIVINSKLTTTFDHRLHTVTGWRRAGDLRIGDIVTTEHGPELVSSIEYKEGSTEVYDLKLRGIPLYYANGYLVHNKL